MESLELQSRLKSPVFWIGLAGTAVQGVISVLLAAGCIDSAVAGAITAGIAGIEGYCIGNNPSLKKI